MASKKSGTDEFGNEIPKVAKKMGSKTMRTIRSTGAEKQGSRAGSSLRARGVEKGNTAGRLSAKNMKTARSSGGESKAPRAKGTTQSARAAGYKPSMSGGTVRSSKADKRAGAGSNKSLRAQGVNEGRVSKAKPSSFPQSARAAGKARNSMGGFGKTKARPMISNEGKVANQASRRKAIAERKSINAGIAKKQRTQVTSPTGSKSPFGRYKVYEKPAMTSADKAGSQRNRQRVVEQKRTYDRYMSTQASKRAKQVQRRGVNNKLKRMK